MKLWGRPDALDQAPRAHNLFRARGAGIQAVHGPLQRLLGASPPEQPPVHLKFMVREATEHNWVKCVVANEKVSNNAYGNPCS